MLYLIMKIKKTYKEFIKESSEYIDEKTINVTCHIQHNDTITQITESKKEIKSEIKGSDYQMVSGIIDILKKVKDKENGPLKVFKKEDIKA